MRNLKTLAAVALMAISSSSILAQEKACPCAEAAYDHGYWSHPYGFVQLQAGGATTFTSGDNFMKLVKPTFSVGVGAMFTPVVGARLHVNGYEQKGLIKSIEKNYTYKYLNSNLDVMLNVSNIFSKNYFKALNVYLIGGVGLNYAWDNDDFVCLKNTYGSDIKEDVSNSWGKGTNRKSLLAHNIRAGVLVDYDICKNFSVGVEADINNTSDRFNSKYNDADDWMLTTQLSLTYKFGHKPAVRPVVEAPVTTQNDYDAAAAAAAEAAAKAAAAKAAAAKAAAAAAAAAAAKAAEVVPLKETFFYKIRVSDVNNEGTFQKIVDWCNKYPGKGITVDGYADKGTGNAKINKKYAEARAKKVADKLKSMGVAADRIQVASYGDTVQPFEANDDNRCVIVIGK